MVGRGGEIFFSKFSLGDLEVEGFSFSSNCLLIFFLMSNDFGSQHVTSTWVLHSVVCTTGWWWSDWEFTQFRLMYFHEAQFWVGSCAWA